MAFVLVQSAAVQCGNQGVATLSGKGNLTVNHETVMCLADVATWPIVGCVSQTPCKKILSVAAGQSQKLTVQGSPALLDSFQGASDGDNPTVSAKSAGQSKLSAK
jgi:hypothetical protein